MLKQLIAFTGGVAIGVLFAPSKGLTRKDWKECLNTFQDALLKGVLDLNTEAEKKPNNR